MKIEINYNITPEFYINWRKMTLAMWLTEERCLVPR